MKLQSITKYKYALLEVEQNGNIVYYRRDIHPNIERDDPIWEQLYGESWESLNNYHDELEEFYQEWRKNG